MKRKSSAELLREVDPELTVIPGGAYPHGPKKKAVKLEEQPKPELPHYEPHKATEEEWEAAAGEICPLCRQPTVRLLPYGFNRKRKACPACNERRIKSLDSKARVLVVRHGNKRGSDTRARMLIIKYNNKHPELKKQYTRSPGG